MTRPLEFAAEHAIRRVRAQQGALRSPVVAAAFDTGGSGDGGRPQTPRLPVQKVRNEGAAVFDNPVR